MASALSALIGLLSVLALAVGHPIYIGCDFEVVSSKSSAGVNVMTTNSESIMGEVPADDDTLVTASTTTFSSGSSATFTFASKYVKGFAHATAGSFTASAFDGVADSDAATCDGTETMIYKTSSGSVGTFTWTAPADASSLSSVTLSFASAASKGQISRHQVTLTYDSDTPVDDVDQVSSSTVTLAKVSLVSITGVLLMMSA